MSSNSFNDTISLLRLYYFGFLIGPLTALVFYVFHTVLGCPFITVLASSGFFLLLAFPAWGFVVRFLKRPL